MTSNDDRSVKARDIIGSQVITGDHNQASMQGVTVTLPSASTVDVASELAALRGATPELRAYGPLFREALESPDDQDVVQIHEAGASFHLEIFRATQNKQLLNIYRPLRLRFRLALALPRYVDHERVRQEVPEHLGILEAIEAGDGEMAERLMRDHLIKGAEARRRIFADPSKTGRLPLVTASGENLT